jgi:hypothetical protein
MQTIGSKAFIGSGVQHKPVVHLPRRGAIVVVRAVAAPVGTALNTKRSEEVSIAHA